MIKIVEMECYINLSATMREYLAEIYRLQEDMASVNTSSLAERLDVSPPAVPRMLRRLQESGFVTHVPYQGARLTDLGQQEALKELRRHRILERFLVDVMGFTWDDAHDHADDMSKGLTDDVVERMAEMTNYPTRCPHGEPIPNADGTPRDVVDFPLSEQEVGYSGTLSRVRTRDAQKLRYFSSIGLLPGTEFEIVGQAPFNGPMRLKLATEEIVVGADLAKALQVIDTANFN